MSFSIRKTSFPGRFRHHRRSWSVVISPLALTMLGLCAPAVPGSAQQAAPPSTNPADRGSKGVDKETTQAQAVPDKQPIRQEANLPTFHFQALLQGWYGNGFGNRINGAIPGEARPQGRNYGMNGDSAVRLRHAELQFDGLLLPKLDYFAMFDLAGATAITPDRKVLEDYYLGYKITRQLRVEVGQQRTGLTEEGSRPDSELLTIARSLMNEDLPATAGLEGNARSFGVAVRFQSTAFQGLVGLWDDNGNTQNQVAPGSRKFLDASWFYNGIPRLSLGLWGGTRVFGQAPYATQDRGGGTFIWQRGPHYMEGEVAYARDYAAGAPAPGKTGSISRGAYWLYAHTLSRKWQLVARYDNWDPAQQGVFTGDATTESGVLIPHANHKLREYTLGINYFLPNDQKIQLNYIREDSEDNGYVFFGEQRTIAMLSYQIGLGEPSRPSPLRGAFDPGVALMSPTTNALRIGLLIGPTTGFAAGFDVHVPHFNLMRGLSTRATTEFTSQFDSPSFFGIPGTTYIQTIDQVYALPSTFGRGSYLGGGVGTYYNGSLRPGAKFFFGGRFSRILGWEIGAHFPALEKRLLTFETRVPL